MKVAQVLKLLRDQGWKLVRVRGSHRQFKHPIREGIVTVSGKPSDDIKRGTLASIIKQAELKIPR